MAVYVDALFAWGWKLRGRETESRHMFTDSADLGELHSMASKIGMKRAWFQDKPGAPHYDLVPSRRAAAVSLGAIEVSAREGRDIRKRRREVVAAQPAQLGLDLSA